MNNNPLFGGDIRNLQPPLGGASTGRQQPNSSSASPTNLQPGPDEFRPGPDEFKGWAQPANELHSELHPGMHPELHPEMHDTMDAEELRAPAFRAAYLNESRPHTPVEAPSMPFAAGSDFDATRRFGSVSSIATTDDDESTNVIYYPWNEQQDELVKSMYEELLNMPQMTPFSGRYPPSGVLHRTAKNTLRMAKHRKIYFPHSMNAVRQRVIYFFHNEPETPDFEKYNSQNDYFSLPVPEHTQPAMDSDDFVFTDVMGPMGRRQSIEDKYSTRLGQSSLQPAFREPSVSIKEQQPLTEEDVVNIVAKRKRDSLRMKRGPH